MNNYNHNEQEIVKESNSLEEQLVKVSLKEQTTGKEKEILKNKIDILSEEYKALEETRIDMLEKTGSILKMIVSLLIGIAVLLFTTHFGIRTIESPVGNTKVLFLLTTLFGTPTLLCSSMFIAAKILNPILKLSKKKFTTTKKYQKKLAEINTKKEELELAKKSYNLIEKEHLSAVLERGRLVAAIQLKKETASILKSELSTNTINKSDEEKPYIKQRIKPNY